MISISRAVPVNPPNEAVQLTRDDVWDGLVLKAQNALPFVKAMNRCEVVARGDDTLLREIEIDGEPFQERVTLTPKRQVRFERTRGRILGTIYNEIEDNDAGELVLRFSFKMDVSGVEPGSAQEIEYQRDMEQSYLRAVDSTLSAVRRLVAERAMEAGR